VAFSCGAGCSGRGRPEGIEDVLAAKFQAVSFFEVATDQVTVVSRNERGPWAVDRDV
jgi:hypothetical protein